MIEGWQGADGGNRIYVPALSRRRLIVDINGLGLGVYQRS